MTHSLIQQTKEKHQQVLGIVKERIVTTQTCSVIEEVQQGGQCGGSLSSCGPKNQKVRFSLRRKVTLIYVTHHIETRIKSKNDMWTNRQM